MGCLLLEALFAHYPPQKISVCMLLGPLESLRRRQDAIIAVLANAIFKSDLIFVEELQNQHCVLI